MWSSLIFTYTTGWAVPKKDTRHALVFVCLCMLTRMAGTVAAILDWLDWIAQCLWQFQFMLKPGTGRPFVSALLPSNHVAMSSFSEDWWETSAGEQ